MITTITINSPNIPYDLIRNEKSYILLTTNIKINKSPPTNDIMETSIKCQSHNSHSNWSRSSTTTKVPPQIYAHLWHECLLHSKSTISPLPNDHVVRQNEEVSEIKQSTSNHNQKRILCQFYYFQMTTVWGNMKRCLKSNNHRYICCSYVNICSSLTHPYGMYECWGIDLNRNLGTYILHKREQIQLTTTTAQTQMWLCLIHFVCFKNHLIKKIRTDLAWMSAPLETNNFATSKWP